MNYLSFEQHGHEGAVPVKINSSIKDQEILLKGGEFTGFEEEVLGEEGEVDEITIEETVRVTPRWESEEDALEQKDEQEEEIESLVVEMSDYTDMQEELTTTEDAPTKIDSVSFEVVQDGAFMISAESVVRYAREFEGGYGEFEKKLKSDWVDKIQDPITVKRPSLVKKSGTNKMDVFTQFSHVTLEEFNEVVALPAIELEAYLAEHHMDAEDFENWKKVIEYWENSDKLAFSVKTSFGDVVRGAFAAKLEEDKQMVSN